LFISFGFLLPSFSVCLVSILTPTVWNRLLPKGHIGLLNHFVIFFKWNVESVCHVSFWPYRHKYYSSTFAHTLRPSTFQFMQWKRAIAARLSGCLIANLCSVCQLSERSPHCLIVISIVTRSEAETPRIWDDSTLSAAKSALTLNVVNGKAASDEPNAQRKNRWKIRKYLKDFVMENSDLGKSLVRFSN